jgi:hypothetical protein
MLPCRPRDYREVIDRREPRPAPALRTVVSQPTSSSRARRGAPSGPRPRSGSVARLLLAQAGEGGTQLDERVADSIQARLHLSRPGVDFDVERAVSDARARGCVPAKRRRGASVGRESATALPAVGAAVSRRRRQLDRTASRRIGSVLTIRASQVLLPAFVPCARGSQLPDDAAWRLAARFL